MRKWWKIGLAAALAMLVSAAASAGEREKVSVHGGVEWGYSMTGYEWTHYNYLGLDGQRRNPILNRFLIGWNAAISGYGELCLWEKCALRVSGGYCGIYPERSGWSAAARGSYFFHGYREDTPLAFLEGAKIWVPSLEGQDVFAAKAGGGYRIALSSWIRLDLLLSVQYTADHPDSYYDKIENAHVKSPQLLRSDAGYATVNLSFALNF